MKYLLLTCFAVSALLLEAPVAAQETPQQRDARHHIDLTAIRAVANFRSADSIDARLQQSGAVLHPQLTALRMRIEAALSEARFEMDRQDYPTAEDALTRAQALLDRFAKAIGGY
jgi:ElaB/YqjD/DUF883 family membrane-anchored ribosome-binding protein